MTTSQMHVSRRVTPEDKAIGSRIIMHRKSKKISQSDLGAALGVSFQQVQKMEKGVNRISSTRLKQISAYLGVTTNDLLEIEAGSEAKSGDADQVIAFLNTTYGFRLARVLMRLSVEQQLAMAKFIEKMIAD